MVNELVAVTGANGEMGGRVARRLGQRGARQRLIVRDVARAPQIPGADVAQAPGGYIDHAGMARALTDAGVLFLVPAAESPNRIKEHSTAVDAALNSYVAGETSSANFPVSTSPAPVQSALFGASDTVLAKLGPHTSGLSFSW